MFRAKTHKASQESPNISRTITAAGSAPLQLLQLLLLLLEIVPWLHEPINSKREQPDKLQENKLISTA